MNTDSLCPRGRELYEEWMVLDARWKAPVYKSGDFPKAMYAYQAYRQHEDECAVCKQGKKSGTAFATLNLATQTTEVPFKKR